MKNFLKCTVSMVATIIGLNSGCKDQGSDITTSPPPTQEISFASQIQAIFNSSSNGCTGCHGGSGGLFLTQGQSYQNLVNQQAQTGCSNLKRVLPFKADSSVLYIRVSSTSADTPCGQNSRMPQGGNRIAQSDIDLIRDWTNQGAKNN